MIIAGLGWVPASLNMLPVGLAFCLGEALEQADDPNGHARGVELRGRHRDQRLSLAAAALRLRATHRTGREALASSGLIVEPRP